MPGVGERVVEPDVLLRKLLPEARTLADIGHGGTSNASALFEAAAPHYREDNLAGVHVYRTTGGWCADVEFATVPAGISNVIGTPVQHPLGTEAEAMEQAKRILAMIVAMSREPAAAPRDPVFLYRGYEVPLPQDMMSAMAALPAGDRGAFVRKRLEDVDSMIGDPTQERMDGMTARERQTFVVVCAMALSQGLMRWPEPRFDDGRPYDAEDGRRTSRLRTAVSAASRTDADVVAGRQPSDGDVRVRDSSEA